MSIPKEPRQLMINLMYLVLTALLALNVSAEIINAFFSLNKGIKASNLIVDKSNLNLKAAIDKQADAYKNPINAAFQSDSDKAIAICKEFTEYITGVTDAMIVAADGIDTHYSDGRPRKYKDKDVTTNMFINQPKGAEVEAKIRSTREALLAVIRDPKDRAEIEKSIPLSIEELPADTKAKNWVEYKFKQMPVAAIMPFFSKLQADSKTSETAILNYIAGKVGGTDIKVDKFIVTISPNNGYVIKGEKFSADVSLAAYSSNPGAGVTINVNGQGLAVKDGVAHYETTASTLGKQTVKASGSIKNPLTGSVETVSKEFTYEVGQRSVALSADKMNVFYIGVDNPISVAAAGVNSNNLKVSATGVNLSGGGGKYVVRADRPGEVSVNVSADGLNQSFPFRVKRIPDPFAQLPISGPAARGGSIGSGTMKAVSQLVAILDGFDFEAKCSIQSYNFAYVAKRQDVVVSQNNGAAFNGTVQSSLAKAKPGDVIYFDDIKGRCPGDPAGRPLNTLVFNVK